MSILDNNNPIVQPQPAELAADRLVMMARQTYNQMVGTFNMGTNVFWNNPQASPTEIAAALGTNAKEIFELHYKLGQLIGSVKPEAIAESAALIGQFTMNTDGTVTVLENNQQE